MQRGLLRAANQSAWNGTLSKTVSTALDSSLKKNTAFIKKARVALTFENLTSLKNDVETLSLEKYITEIVSAVAEGLGKVRLANDVIASTEIVSLLHQRFSTNFTPLLAFHIVRALAPAPASYLNTLSTEQREKEESNRVIRQKYLLRIATELWLLRVFRTIQDAIDASGLDLKRRKVEDYPLPIFCLRELLNGDQEFNNLSIVTSFVKCFPSLLPSTQPPNELITAEDSRHIQAILEKYFEALKRHLTSQSRTLSRELNRLEEQLTLYGSNPSSRENSIHELQKTHEKQVALAQILAQSLQSELPTFTVEEESPTIADSGMIRGVGGSKVDPGTSGIWEDEDQRRFYEVLVDLQAVVPSDMLTEGKHASPVSKSATSNTALDTEPSYDDADLDAEVPAEEEEPEQPSATIGTKVESLLIRLPEMNNTELIDKAAVEFAFLNSKASRNRLLKTLLAVPVNRGDILPYYARFVAILNVHMPSIGETMVNSLHRECRRFVARKNLQSALYLRLHNVRYLSELLKFGVAPPHVVIHCLRIAIESFTTYDIEVISLFLENCGRFLLRTAATSAHMQNILDTLKRKSGHLSGVERGLIDSAFYYVNPPEHSGLPQNVQSDIEQYIDHLIYLQLSKKTYEKVLRQLRKLDWADPDIHQYMMIVFTQIWRVKQASLPLLANLLYALAKFRPAFAYQVIDTILEAIVQGLEDNKFRDNQKRIAAIKFISELYICKMLDSQLIFRALYLLMSHGHANGKPSPSYAPPSDPAEDFFRVRLVLAILDTCGHCFNNASLQKRLDTFLCFFQYYLKIKSAVPLEIDFAVKTTLAKLRPGLEICASIEDAARELDEAVKISKSPVDETAEVDDESNSTTSPTNLSVTDEDDLSERSADSDFPEELDSGDADESQDYVLLEKEKVKNELDKEADEDFEREFGRMLLETSENRKVETRKALEIVLPIKKYSPSQHITDRGRSKTNGDLQGADNDAKQSAVSFTLLSRKGRARMLNLPKDSTLAMNNAARKMAELEEKKTIRELTLRYEDAQNRTESEDSGRGILGNLKHLHRKS